MPDSVRVIGALVVEQAKTLWPFYLAAVTFAAVIKTFKWDKRIRKRLGGRR